MNLVCVVSDSRGAKLQAHLNLIHDDRREFKVIVKRGADLTKLWSLAEKELVSPETAMVFIYGGVCNLTDIFHNIHGQRMAWPPPNIIQRVNDICSTMENIVEKFKALGTNKYLSFIPEAGLNLITYNRIPEPVRRKYLETQEKLESLLPEIQTKARYLNDQMNSATAWSLDATHTKRGRHMIPIYSRLPDGLHPDEKVAKKIAIAIASAAGRSLDLGKKKKKSHEDMGAQEGLNHCVQFR